MRREEFGDLTAFLTVAEERSFTRAAARLGTSQSALSYTLRRLKSRLGVRLLTRTTRSVAPTEPGERLLGALGPAIDNIEGVLAALSEFREKPAGSFRITAGEHAITTILAGPFQAATRLPRHQNRTECGIGLDRHCRGAVRRRRTPW